VGTIKAGEKEYFINYKFLPFQNGKFLRLEQGQKVKFIPGYDPIYGPVALKLSIISES
jgi:cold shock CspA family protein